jgi:argininosuccinate synthase
MTRIVLAYSGCARGSAAIGWLRERHQAEVIALTVDVGQERDLEAVRERALGLGVTRAHVLDRRDACAAAAFATLRAGAGVPLEAVTIARLAHPVVAEALAEVAGIEHADLVAHAADAGDTLLPALIARHTALPIVGVAAEWTSTGTDAMRESRARGVTAPALRWTASRHLLCRPVAEAPLPAAGSSVQVRFAAGVPVAVSDVAFSPAELVDCLSLLGGRHGVGRLTGSPGVVDAPAAVVLHAAYAALPQPAGVVQVMLRQGSCTAAPESTSSSPSSQLVNHA